MARLLFLVSNATEIALADGSSYPTGYFAEEALIPFRRFTDAGVDVVVATVDGLPPHIDDYGLESFFHYPDEDEDFLASVTRTFERDADDIRLTLRHLTELQLITARRIVHALRAAGLTLDESRQRVETAARITWRTERPLLDVMIDESFAEPLDRDRLEAILAAVLADSEAAAAGVADTLTNDAQFQRPVSLAALSDADIASFDALFVPGGHGPMVDLADNFDVSRCLRILHDRHATIGSLCHGPAALLAAPHTVEGHWLFDGYRLTAFSNEEEEQTPAGKRGLAWLLESALKNAGAVFDDSPLPWTSHVVVDRNLITAQNPMSADAVADAVLKSLDLL